MIGVLKTCLDMKACRSLPSRSVTCTWSITTVCGPCGSEQPPAAEPARRATSISQQTSFDTLLPNVSVRTVLRASVCAQGVRRASGTRYPFQMVLQKCEGCICVGARDVASNVDPH